jgi:hypothetical protein
VGGSVRIQLHRDGRFTLWTPPERGDTLLEPSHLLLRRSLVALSDAGTKLRWPPELPGDSLAFDLGYRFADVGLDGTTRPFVVRAAAIPVFSMAMPRGKEVGMLRPPHLTYPPEERASGVEGAIFLEFVVDSAGRVVSNTIKDYWPMNRPRLSGWSGARYQSFVNAAKLALTYARFDPATIGGCPVKQLAQQPFTFTLQR